MRLLPELTTRTLPPAAAALLVLGAAALAWFLYRREVRLVGRGTARCLVALRLTVAILCAALASDPVLVRHESLERKGQVLVVVDGSSSLALTDPMRPAMQIDAEAQALGSSREEMATATR